MPSLIPHHLLNTRGLTRVGSLSRPFKVFFQFINRRCHARNPATQLPNDRGALRVRALVARRTSTWSATHISAEECEQRSHGVSVGNYYAAGEHSVAEIPGVPSLDVLSRLHITVGTGAGNLTAKFLSKELRLPEEEIPLALRELEIGLPLFLGGGPF